MAARAVIEVVAFAPRHAGGVVDVVLAIQRGEFEIPISLDDQPDLRDVPGFYQKGSGNFWVAVSQGQVVGTIGLIDIGNRQGALRKMSVRAEHRGAESGVARRLLETLLGWCRAHGVDEVFLGTTAKYLAAHRFYEKSGFEELAKDELPPSFPPSWPSTRSSTGCHCCARMSDFDAGWGVDALLGEQTRSHADLDVVVRAGDVTRIRERLGKFGVFRLADGRKWPFPPAAFQGRGRVSGRELRCFSGEAQVQCHGQGYAPTEKDLRDMEHLQARFGVVLPLILCRQD